MNENETNEPDSFDMKELECDFGAEDETRTCIEDADAAMLLAASLDRSVLTALAAASAHGVRQVTVTLPEYEPDTADAMAVSFLSLAEVMQKAVSARHGGYTEESAMRRLGIQPAGTGASHE
jgi:hypothetical protein